MLTISPKPPPTPDRVADLRGQFDQLFAGLADLQAGITTRLAATGGDAAPGRSPLAEERDVRTTVNRLTDMVNQAQRELSTDRPLDALYTLQAVRAVVGGELRVRLEAWFQAERHPIARGMIETWLENLDNLQDLEAPC